MEIMGIQAIHPFIFGSAWMRTTLPQQDTLDCPGILNVKLNLKCRHEIIPILRGLQHIYSQPSMRDQILDLIAAEVNEEVRADRGRRGMDYWQIMVLMSVRLGCNLNYDALQDLAEQHMALRQIMGMGDWDDTPFDWRRIQDNLLKLSPQTIEQISMVVVAAGHELAPDSKKKRGLIPLSRRPTSTTRRKAR